MHIQQNVPLAPYTTFKIGGEAEYFCIVTSQEELQEALAFAKAKSLPVFVLGGGSNMLISDIGIQGLVIKVQLAGIEKVEETEAYVMLKIGAGEWWDGVVAYTVEHGWWGVENLSHIPGLAGGLAVQNVGAYGQEASQVLTEVETVDLQTNTVRIFHAHECGFGYRKSIFNSSEKGQYVITAVTLKLSKAPSPNLKYPDLQKKFPDAGTATHEQIRQAIISIRNTKFPYPDKPEHGNAGSFFKNTELTPEQYIGLEKMVTQNFNGEVLTRLQEIKNKFPTATGLIKIPTAFLIEICDLKGYTNGLVTVNPPQPMILVNSSGKAMAKDVLDVFKKVRQIVYQKTSVVLQNEPELIGFSDKELDDIFVL